MKKPPASLREKFADACAYMRGREKQRVKDIEKTIDGTMDDFYRRFDEIAAGLKPGLEGLIDDIDNGRSLVSHPMESYKHNLPPLYFRIAVPVTNRDAVASHPDPQNMLWDVPGYHKIHELCAANDVDMHVRTAMEFSGYTLPNGDERRYLAFVIELSPAHGYLQPEDYRPLNPAATPKPPQPKP